MLGIDQRQSRDSAGLSHLRAPPSSLKPVVRGRCIEEALALSLGALVALMAERRRT